MQRFIDIADLHHPVATPLQQRIQRLPTPPVELTERAVCEAAVRATGLNNFGAEDFRERLRVWLAAIAEDSGLSAGARAHLFRNCTGFAATRLRLEDLIARHPQITTIPIERPIVITGLPRSGTSHLLSLLATDARFRSLPRWEALSPMPDSPDPPDGRARAVRWHRAHRDWLRMRALLPHMNSMHDVSPDEISEDTELQAIDFSSYLLEWEARVPAWRDYYLAHDQGSTYSYLRRVLQALTFLRGSNRWVTKCPQHLEQLHVVRRIFPDALIVITHRDPVASIQSALTMISYSSRVSRHRVDPLADARYWVDRFERLLRRYVSSRESLGSESIVDISFEELTRAPQGTLEAIYRKAQLAPPSLPKAGAPAPRTRFSYHLRRDFGLDPDSLSERFGFYLNRFAVRAEVR